MARLGQQPLPRPGVSSLTAALVLVWAGVALLVLALTAGDSSKPQRPTRRRRPF